MKKIYQLFAGRHEIPNNPPALYKEFDFQKFIPVSNGYNEQNALDILKKGGKVVIYVTGLTPALTHFIAEAIKIGNGNLILNHFNKQSGEYIEQKIF